MGCRSMGGSFLYGISGGAHPEKKGSVSTDR